MFGVEMGVLIALGKGEISLITRVIDESILSQIRVLGGYDQAFLLVEPKHREEGRGGTSNSEPKKSSWKNGVVFPERAFWRAVFE